MLYVVNLHLFNTRLHREALNILIFQNKQYLLSVYNSQFPFNANILFRLYKFSCSNEKQNVMCTTIHPLYLIHILYTFLYLALLQFWFLFEVCSGFQNVDVVIQNMTFRPKGVAAVKPKTSAYVCMCVCVFQLARSLIQKLYRVCTASLK